MNRTQGPYRSTVAGSRIQYGTVPGYRVWYCTVRVPGSVLYSTRYGYRVVCKSVNGIRTKKFSMSCRFSPILLRAVLYLLLLSGLPSLAARSVSVLEGTRVRAHPRPVSVLDLPANREPCSRPKSRVARDIVRLLLLFCFRVNFLTFYYGTVKCTPKIYKPKK